MLAVFCGEELSVKPKKNGAEIHSIKSREIES